MTPDRGLFADVRLLLRRERGYVEPFDRGTVRTIARERLHGETLDAARRVLAATDGMSRASMHALFVLYER